MLASVRDANASGAARRRAATTQTVASARASERRNGPCREQPPHSSTETDDGKGRGGSARRTARPRSGRCSPPGGRHTVLCHGRG